MEEPFPEAFEAVLSTRVAFYRALDPAEKERFRKLVRIFLDEVRVTGIRTEVDDVVLALVGASAVIPIFGFPDWEYARLGEVLIYPGSFDSDYRTEGTSERPIIGMTGLKSLRGVMILSKPDLIAGFERPTDRINVGLHEFAHLVDIADGHLDGLPPGVPLELARQWVAYVADELRDPPDGKGLIEPYGYTDEAEYFAVLSEYFFEQPGRLKEKDPVLYERLERMFRQDTNTRLSGVRLPRKIRLGRNVPCPCGSGRKYKRCCLASSSSRSVDRGIPALDAPRGESQR